MLARRALIRVGHRCNNQCLFCHRHGHGAIDVDNGTVADKVRRAKELGYSLVAFSGGEPTIRRELRGWAGIAQQLGIGVGLITNGRMLAYPALVSELMSRGLAYAHVSLHAESAALHNELVQAGAFEQTIAGIRALAAHPLELCVGCVVTGKNLRSLRGIVDLLAPLGNIRLKFAMVEPKGAVLEHLEALLPRVDDAASAVGDAIGYGVAHSSLRIVHEGFPLCSLPGYEDLAEGLRAHGFTAISDVQEDDFHPVEPEARVYPPSCRDCGLRGRCPGLHAGYAECWGSGGLQTRTCERSNSFTYVPVRRLDHDSTGTCPVLLDGVTPYHKTRNLFLEASGSLVLVETHTTDFSDEELGESVRDLGQVYLDRTDKMAPNEFARDLLQLVQSESCSACAEHGRCPGRWKAGGDVFLRDDAELRDMLSKLHGRVLDVGCGAGRYLGAMNHAAIAKDLDYTGVDPDPEALARLHEAWPWATVRECRIEQLELEPRSFDHVVMIGSVNHLSQPDLVLERIVSALRPGGTLLLADDVAFGLVRNVRHAERCAGSGAGFEHFRLDDMRRARERLRGFAGEILGQREVVRGTSNQWFIHFLRSFEA